MYDPSPPPCPERQACFNKASDFLFICNMALTGVSLTCTAVCTATTDGIGLATCFQACNAAMLGKRAGCLLRYETLLQECRKISCGDCPN